MISATATTAIKTYLDSKSLGVPVYAPRNNSVIEYPCIQVMHLNSNEHEILDGVYETSIEVAYVATPNESSNAGETTEDIDSKIKLIYDHLTSCLMIDFLNIQKGFKVFDIWLQSTLDEERDGRSATVYTLDLVCCEV